MLLRSLNPKSNEDDQINSGRLTPSSEGEPQLLIEIQNGDQFVRTQTLKGGLKCMVRVEFSGLQKKTKKNSNCFNPKFYELLRFNLSRGLGKHIIDGP